LVKNTEQMAHKITLLFTEVHTLWAANKALSKRHRAKKARIRKEGVLIVENIQDFLSQKDIEEQV